MKRTVQYAHRTFEEMYSPEELQQIVQHLAAALNKDYAARNSQTDTSLVPLVICVLNGAVFFMADLMRAVDFDFHLTFVRLRSYSGMESTGTIQEIVPLQEDVHGRDVIIIEDIVDSGLTMHHFKQKLLQSEPRSLKLVTLFFKPSELMYDDARPDYYGAEISKEFIIGYGLDLDECARGLDAIYKLS